MISEKLGLSIKKSILNSSPSNKVSPASTIRKTAKNYLALGNIAQDLHIANLNFITYVNFYGGKARNKADGHILSDDERTRKFGVLRQKFLSSFISKDSKDGLSQHRGKSLFGLQHYLRKKFTKRFERKINAKVMRQLRKIKIVRKFFAFKRQVLKALANVLSRFNFKKMVFNFIKTNYKKLITPMFKAIERSWAKIGIRLGARAAATALGAAASSWSGPGAIAVAAVIWFGYPLYEGIRDAIKSFSEDGDLAKAGKTFIVSFLESTAMGLFEREDISTFVDSFAGWYMKIFAKLFEVINKVVTFISNKLEIGFTKLLTKGKSVVDTLKDFFRPGEYLDEMSDKNKALAEQQAADEKRARYNEYLSDQIYLKRKEITRLKGEIQALELEEEQGVLSPAAQKKDEEQAEFERKNEELRLLEKEKEVGYTGDDPTVRKRLGLPEQSYNKRKEEEKKEEKKARDEQLENLSKQVEKEGYNRGEKIGKSASLDKGLGGYTAPAAKPTQAPVETTFDESSSKGVISSAEQFVSIMYEPARKAAAKLNVPVLGLLAQWATESGWGKKPAGDYNYFGLKSFGKPPQKLVTTRESNLSKAQIDYYKQKGWFIKQAGSSVIVKDLFKSYSSVDQAVMAQADFLLTNPRYAKAGVFGTKTPLEYGEALRKAGYATDPKYAKAIESTAKSVRTRLASAEKLQYADNGEFVGSGGTKLAQASPPPAGPAINQKSKQVAQAQREQLKPTDVDVINVAKTNNQKVDKNTTVAATKPVNSDALVERMT
jgi:flagellum-specific peptidoglycan hydrolase FlgJ/transposase